MLVYTDYGYGHVDLVKFQASLEQMASKSQELEEAISNYFIAQYTDLHQKEVSEEEAKVKAAREKEAKADAVKAEPIAVNNDNDSKN